MRCPYCEHEETKVVDKRDIEDAKTTRRRRECLKCEKRWTTYEKIDVLDITVIKKDGTKEPFDRQKLEKGIRICLEKRPISEEQIVGIIDRLESKLRALGKSQIPSIQIGKMVMQKLQKVDEVAYLRFASVYKDFKDASQFKEELKILQNK